jgi:hypothetical protein
MVMASSMLAFNLAPTLCLGFRLGAHSGWDHRLGELRGRSSIRQTEIHFAATAITIAAKSRS